MEPQEMPIQVAKEFAWVYLRLHRLVGRQLAAAGTSQAQMKLLAFLEDGGKRSTDIAGYFGHSPRTVTQAVDALEAAGCVRRAAVPEDRRAKIIEITDRGRESLNEVRPLYEDILRQTFGTLTDKELAELRQLLKRMALQIDQRERG